MTPAEIGELVQRLYGTDRGLLTLEIGIEENRSYAALDVIIPTLDAALFCGWVCEITHNYISYIEAERVDRHRADPAIQLFDDLIRGARNDNWSWVDYYENRFDYYRQLRRIQALTISNGGVASSYETLRLELTSFRKVNPNVFQVAVLGVTGSVALAISSLGMVHLMQEYGAETCRQQYINAQNLQVDHLAALSRREGRWTNLHQESLRDILVASNINVAACGAAPIGISGGGRQTENGPIFNFALSAGQVRNRLGRQGR